MRVSILCSDFTHPVYSKLMSWKERHRDEHSVEIVDEKLRLAGGDFLFLISCHEFVESGIRNLYQYALVLHASDLPEGRGWSPHIWQILEGRSELTVSLLEAIDEMDAGDIWAKERICLEGHELNDEIGEAIFDAELRLMDFAIENVNDIQPEPQPEFSGAKYPRRSLEDSRLDPMMSIADQFNLIRVADPVRYPSFFDFRGCRYRISILKVDSD